MRIVSRKEFLKLPPGTLYQQCAEPWAFDNIMVKWDSLIYDDSGDGDWVCSDITDIQSNDSGEYFERLDDMLTNGASYPLDLDTGSRDGSFVRDAVFMIYERADITKLKELFTRLEEGNTDG